MIIPEYTLSGRFLKSIDFFNIIKLYQISFKKKIKLSFIYNTVFKSGEIPPCKAKNFPFTKQDTGIKSKESINIS